MRGSIILLAVFYIINTAQGQDFVRLKWKSNGRIGGVRYEFEKISENDWVERQNGKLFARHAQASIDSALSDMPTVVLRRTDGVYSRLNSAGEYYWGKSMGRITNLVGLGTWVNDSEDSDFDQDIDSVLPPPPFAEDADGDFKRAKWTSVPSGAGNITYEFEKFSPKEWVERRNNRFFAFYTELNISNPNVEDPTVVLQRLGRRFFVRITSNGVATSGATRQLIATPIGSGSWEFESSDSLYERYIDSFDDDDLLARDSDDFKRQRWTSDEPVNNAIVRFEKITANEWVQRRNGIIFAVYSELSNSNPNVDDPTVILQRIGRNDFIRITFNGAATSGRSRRNINTPLATGTWTNPDTPDSLAELDSELIQLRQEDSENFVKFKYTGQNANGDVTFVFEKISRTEWMELQNGRLVAIYTENEAPSPAKPANGQTKVILKRLTKQVLFVEILENGEARRGNDANTVADQDPFATGQWRSPENIDSLEFAPLQDSLADLDSDDSTPIAEKAKKVCKKTCEKKNLIWSGLFTTKDGKCIETCKCDNQDVVVNGQKYVDVVPKDSSATNRQSPSVLTARRVCPSACASFGWSWTGLHITFDGFTVHSCRCNGGRVVVG